MQNSQKCRWKNDQRKTQLEKAGLQVIEIYTCELMKFVKENAVMEKLYAERLKQRQNPLDITSAIKGGKEI